MPHHYNDPYDPKSGSGTDTHGDDGAFDTPLTTVLDPKTELANLQTDANRASDEQGLAHIDAIKKITGDIYGGNVVDTILQGVRSQAVFSHDANALGAVAQARDAQHETSIGALHTALANKEAGFDLALERQGGQTEFDTAEIVGRTEAHELNTYASAIANMYSGGSTAGFAMEGDRNLVKAAELGRDSLERDLTELTSDNKDYTKEIELQRKTAQDSFGSRITAANQQREFDADTLSRSIERQGILSGADQAQTKEQIKRAKLGRELEIERLANSENLQQISLDLTNTKEPYQLQLLQKEGGNVIHQMAQNDFYSILLKGGIPSG